MAPETFSDSAVIDNLIEQLNSAIALVEKLISKNRELRKELAAAQSEVISLLGIKMEMDQEEKVL